MSHDLEFEDLSDLEWEPEPDLPEYDFEGRAYHRDGTRYELVSCELGPDYDATIYSGVK